MGISQSLPALRRRGYELCEQQAVWTNLVYYVLVKRYTGRLYVEVWRRVPLASAIAPPMSNFTKEIRPSHMIAGVDAVMQFASNCHASLPSAHFNDAERW